MTDNPLQAEPTEKDSVFDLTLRPPSLAEFVGQELLKDTL